MTIKILSIATATIILSACAQQKKATDSTSAGNNNNEIARVASSSSTSSEVMMQSDMENRGTIQQIAMERSACFGTCPVYRVEVNSDGSVVYIGRHYTDYEGTYRHKFSADKVADLFKQFKEYRVDTCSEEYESLIQDVPGIFYYITYNNNKQQEIRNAHFGPEFLKRLALEVDNFAKVDDSWEQIDYDVEK